jgi:RNA polymerase sigma-70 factor (ECF subfamily)
MSEPDWHRLNLALRADLRAWGVQAADVDDAAQEVLLRLHEQLRSGQTVLNPVAWVRQVARRVLVDRWRISAREAELPDERAAAPEPDHGPSLLHTGLAAWVAAEINALPEPYQDALRLVDLQGHSRQEAATRLGLSYRGLNSRVQRGRELLAERLHRCCAVAVDARGAPIEAVPRERCGC